MSIVSLIKVLRRPKKNRKGFTLIEIIIMLVIMGILGAIVMPGFAGALGTMYLNGAARKMLTDIRYTRELALSQHDTFGISFNVGANSYSIFKVNVGGGTTVINSPHTNTAMTMAFASHPEFSGVSIQAAGQTQIRFDPFGKPLDSNGATLAANVDTVLQQGASTRTVRVTQQTGFSQLV